MGHKPKPRYDRYNKSWWLQYDKKRHYLGRDEATAYRKAAAIMGANAIAERPTTVAEAVDTWRLLHGGKWEQEVLELWMRFADASKQRLLATLPKDHLRVYMKQAIADGQSEWTIRHKIRLASTVLKWCQQEGYVESIPEIPRTPKPRHQPRDVPVADVAAVLAELPEKTRTILEFIVQSGCRPNEACELTWGEVDLERGVCVLDTHKTKHRGRVRTIYLTPRAAELIADRQKQELAKAKKGRGYVACAASRAVFHNRLHRPFKPSGLRSVLYRAGIPGVYCLRHTAAQQWLERGVPMEDVAKLLGHASLRTVQTYAQVRDARARQVAASLTSLLPEHPVDQAPPSKARKKPASKRRQGKKAKRKRKSSKARRSA